MQANQATAGFADTDYSELVGSIYDAAVTPALWNGVLESCRDFIGGHSATVFAKNVSGNRRALYHTDNRLAADLVHSYFNRLSPIDPSNSVQVLAAVEQAVITSRALNPEDFLGSRFAREWAQPAGLVDMVVAPIERRGSWAALFGVFRHERDGLGDEAVRQRVSLLAPHIRRAVSIGDIIGEATGRADSFRDVVDGLAAGVFLVDAEGRLVHANRAAQALLGASTEIGAARLDRTGLRDLLPRADGVAPQSAYIEMADGQRLVAHVLPLASGSRRFSGLGGDAVAALFVQPANFEPTSVPESLARAFDLTPAELRVALATLHHDRVADVAENLGVAETTVKTHLSRIFSKTDTKRQADIVKLVAAFASPLAPH